MIYKTIEISGKQVTFKSSAALPRLYRSLFGQDIFQDMMTLEQEYSQKDEGQIAVAALELFECVAFAMAKHASPDSVADTPEQWLEQFEMFSIYLVLPEILELWSQNLTTTVEPKKKGKQKAKGN